MLRSWSRCRKFWKGRISFLRLRNPGFNCYLDVALHTSCWWCRFSYVMLMVSLFIRHVDDVALDTSCWWRKSIQQVKTKSLHTGMAKYGMERKMLEGKSCVYSKRKIDRHAKSMKQYWDVISDVCVVRYCLMLLNTVFSHTTPICSEIPLDQYFPDYRLRPQVGPCECFGRRLFSSEKQISVQTFIISNAAQVVSSNVLSEVNKTQLVHVRHARPDTTHVCFIAWFWYSGFVHHVVTYVWHM